MDSEEELVRDVTVDRWEGNAHYARKDCVVVEEPLEVRVNDVPLAVTMRTPGDDESLALGFLVSEGIVHSVDDVFDVLRCADPNHPDVRNIVNVVVDPARTANVHYSSRQRYATSSCGLCGRATIESVRACTNPIDDRPVVSHRVLISLPGRLRSSQTTFERTGGLHAAGLFSLTGELLHAAEDVGRHNAVDKVIGKSLRFGPWPPTQTILMVSGRAGFEIVQKAAAAGIPVVCSVSAPSSLAVELAVEVNILLAGFLRGDSMNVYSGNQNVMA